MPELSAPSSACLPRLPVAVMPHLLLLLLLAASVLGQQESYSGDGFMECYGEMEVELHRESGEGFIIIIIIIIVTIITIIR